ncbi:hypothetical protein KY284_001096 [Solanum tuberosum]|nr:hypothetical protein KY284_001096 [Solanum tuberosum]
MEALKREVRTLSHTFLNFTTQVNKALKLNNYAGANNIAGGGANNIEGATKLMEQDDTGYAYGGADHVDGALGITNAALCLTNEALGITNATLGLTNEALGITNAALQLTVKKKGHPSIGRRVDPICEIILLSNSVKSLSGEILELRHKLWSLTHRLENLARRVDALDTAAASGDAGSVHGSVCVSNSM